MDYFELAKKVSNDIRTDENVLAVLLYGSVARGTAGEDSDIDLLVLTKSFQLEKRQKYYEGVIVEFLEIHEDFLMDFIEKDEIPMLVALTEGKLLYDNRSSIRQLMKLAEEKWRLGPQNKKLDSEEYQVYLRSKLTEMYKDLKGLEGISFSYLSFEIIRMIVPILYYQEGRWLKNEKELLPYLKEFYGEAYLLINRIMEQNFSIDDRIQFSRKLINLTLKAYGGMVEGDCVIFRKTSLPK